jgi:omega-hydroxy-beta-dihydromenaquinone-9 sulfotransferase
LSANKVSQQYLNLTSSAWRQLRRNWQLPATPMLLWQTLGPGAVLSAMSAMQQATSRDQLAQANLRDAIVVLGYWRSGTTLLHELLCLDPRYTYPTTHACMNPHHFLFSETSALARKGVSAQRPMDEMEVRPDSPQEDEFALLSLGARSPYEALIIPKILPEALKLTDPKDLSPDEEKHWREVFLGFLRGVSVRGSSKPIILKSPTHGARVSTLRQILPDARYILIIRDPITNFESVVRMWRKMFETYALGPIPSDDDIREAVLVDRPRFEAKLAAATSDLPGNRFAIVTYEALAADPLGSIAHLYPKLEMGDFAAVRDAVVEELGRRKGYQAKSALPSDAWQKRIRQEWSPILANHSTFGQP